MHSSQILCTRALGSAKDLSLEVGGPSAAAGTKPDADRQPTHEEGETASARSHPLSTQKINERRTSHVTSRDQGAAASDQLPRTRAMQGTLNESLQHQLFSHRVLCGRSYILTYRAISRRKQCLFVGWVVGVAFESSRCSLPSI